MSNPTPAPDLLAEIESMTKTIERLEEQVEHWKSVCQDLKWDNEDCDAEMMKKEAWMA